MKNLLLIVLILFAAIVNAQIISTIAGTGVGGYNGDGNVDTLTQLYGPQGMAFDSSGNLYFADMVNHRVRKINKATGIVSTVAGTGTGGYNGDGIIATSAQIANPSALAFDAAGNLYFTDRTNHRIRKITTSTGIITTVAGTGTAGYNGDGIDAATAQLNNPNEVAFDKNGNLFIADWLNHRVRKVDKITGFISTVAGTGTGSYNGDGIAATAAQINGPCGITFDKTGNIYVAEYGGARVRKIDTITGLISTIAGTGVCNYNGDGVSATTANLCGPAYIRFDGAGNLYIGEGTNQRVRKIAAGTGIISTIAGNGTGGYNGDWITPASAQLNYPYEIIFDSSYNLYIADYSNNRIRKITGLPGMALPKADFTASGSSFCNEAGACVDFFDQSSGNATAWRWSFPGATPDTSIQQNPSNICYYVSGKYPVTLIVFNAAGSDTLTISPMITFGTGAAVPTITLSHDTLFSSPAVSYQWYYNGNPIAGAVDSFNIISGSGTYAVKITDSLGCSRSSNDFLITSANDIPDKNFITIVSGSSGPTAIIRFNAPLVKANIIIYDALGKRILGKTFSGSNVEIEKGELQAGIYFLQVVSAGEMIVNQKMIIQ